MTTHYKIPVEHYIAASTNAVSYTNTTVTSLAQEIAGKLRISKHALESGEPIVLDHECMPSEMAEHIAWAYKKLGWSVTFAPDNSSSTWVWADKPPVRLPHMEFF